MGWQEVIALLIASVCAFFAARSVYSIFAGKNGCSKGCHCAAKNSRPIRIESLPHRFHSAPVRRVKND
ncbi:MAG: hypothetical protein AB1656_02200 [Candidatus Omnitrophota bacterium]